MEEKLLFEAASTGNVAKLVELHQKDRFTLDRISHNCPNNTPLHIATMNNHLRFVEKILELNPHLSEELNSNQSSPLHIAAAKGHLEIAKRLFEAAPDMCLSRDLQGRNPLHLAVVKGRVPVVEELVRRSAGSGRERAGRGDTALHLCVRYGRVEALKVLVEHVRGMVGVKNGDGETVMDMAIAGEQREIIQYLKKHSSSSINTNGNSTISETTPAKPQQPQTQQPVKWLTKKRDTIMVVAILVATMAFQIGVSPPGGIWQEDSKDMTYRAGESIMAHKHSKAFKAFMKSNSICFVSSLSTILLLIGGLPFKRRMFMWILMVIMWLTITSVAVTFAISVVVVTPKKDKKSLKHVIYISVSVWIGVMGILLIGNTVRLVDRWLKKKKGVDVLRRVRVFVQGKKESGGEGAYV